MREPEVFITADRALQNVVDQIADDQWSMVMPSEFAMRSIERPTLRDVVNNHAYEDAWVPDMVAGRTMDEVGQDAYKGDLLGDDPKKSFAALVASASAAVKALSDADLDRTVHTSFGDFSVREYLWQTNMFRGLRVYDIAQVIGVDATLPDDLVEGLWEEIRPIAEEWRQLGIFGPKVEVPDDAPLQHKLLGLTGRTPQ